jgi:hypothetical protein
VVTSSAGQISNMTAHVRCGPCIGFLEKVGLNSCFKWVG